MTRPRPYHFVLIGLCAAALAGCMRPQPSPTELLSKALNGFHGHLLFQRYDEAAGYVPAAMREAFLDYYQEREGFHITEFETTRLEVSEDEHAARALVVLSWYQLPSMTVQTTRMDEKWTYDDVTSRWHIDEQKPVDAQATDARSVASAVDDPEPQ
jgi:hypothetical protein